MQSLSLSANLPETWAIVQRAKRTGRPAQARRCSCWGFSVQDSLGASQARFLPILDKSWGAFCDWQRWSQLELQILMDEACRS